MLTGDKAASARIIANEVGIDDVQSELFPEDKVAAVKNATESTHQNQSMPARIMRRITGESRNRQVTMMVGDGVNDAPVLAVADIGMAMTDGTSTAASESAQVVIMNDDIASVPRAIAIARRTKNVMLQAVLVGLSLAIIGMVAAAFNLIPVVVGAFMQEVIDVVSILWALTVLSTAANPRDCGERCHARRFGEAFTTSLARFLQRSIRASTCQSRLRSRLVTAGT